MGIFKGEQYSREAYDEAQEKAISEEKAALYRGTITGMTSREAQRIYNELWSASAQAQERVEKLYGKSQQEATELNGEYERLRAKAREALQAVADFEHEKLGIASQEEKE